MLLELDERFPHRTFPEQNHFRRRVGGPARHLLCRNFGLRYLKALYGTAERMEQELGEERQLNLFEGAEEDWEQQALPDGPMTVGLDGGYVRAAHKQGWFEVITGKSVVAFRRGDAGEVPSAKCFGFVQTYDEKPRRRLWELLKSQGMQENQQVVFLSDGGENVRRVQEYQHLFSEHLIDWFHITMRLTVLQQQTKGLQEERPGHGRGRIEAPGEREASALARKHRGSPGAVGRSHDRPESDPGALRSGKESGGRRCGIRDVHSQQSGVHPEFRRASTARGDDQHGIRRVDDQSSGQPAIREETADAVDATRGPPFAANQDEGAQRGSGRRVPWLVSEIPAASPNAAPRAQGGLTPDLLTLSVRGPNESIKVGQIELTNAEDQSFHKKMPDREREERGSNREHAAVAGAGK